MRKLILHLVLLGVSGAFAAEPSFSSGANLGTVDFGPLRQASGVALSPGNANVLWTHNDAGDAPRIFALDTQGRALGTYELSGSKLDYEDIAIGPGPMPGVSYVFVGDIGDNNEARASVSVSRLPEPAVFLRQAANPPTLPVKGFVSITLIYPDGPHNAETLLVDPLTGDLFIATKEAGRSRIYSATKAQLDAANPITLELVGEVPFDLASGGAISPTGGEIILRQEDFAQLWLRPPGQTVAAALAGTPVSIPVIGRPTEPNGEAIGFDPSGGGYYTLSDSANTQPLYYFARTSAFPFAPPHTLVAAGGTWRYLDTGTDQGIAWRQPGFNDAAWKTGDGPLGYGDGDEQTVVSFGGNSNNRFITTYFRKTFTATGAAGFGGLALRMQFDDGAAVYLNGNVVVRANLSANALFNTVASVVQEDLEDTWFTYAIDPALLVEGVNTLAVEVHQQAANSPDLSFDLSLTAYDSVSMSCAITRLADGSARLHVTGAPFSRVAVEASANLTTWETIGETSLGVGTALFDDRVAAGLPQRFFRFRRR
jgi:hypothetical protein